MHCTEILQQLSAALRASSPENGC